MIRSFYDVIVLGGRLGAWASAALLARRGFRVLLIGQDDLGPTYEVEGESLPRAPFRFLGVHTPIARRLFTELALTQAMRRHTVASDARVQVVTPGHRLDVAGAGDSLGREIEREFPEIRGPIETVFERIRGRNEALDRATEADLVWPPETFFERRAHARAVAPLNAKGPSSGADDPLRDLPDAHPFRLTLHAPTRFSDGMDPDHGSPLRLSRHVSQWLEGGTVVEGGLGTILGMLETSVRSHGGDVRSRDRVDSLLVRRGAVEGVRLAASGEEFGASFVLVGSDVSQLLRLVPDRRPFDELFERMGEPMARYYRYTLNVHVKAEGVPMGMGRDVFFVRDPARALSGANLLHVQAHPVDPSGRRLLCVEALLPRRGVEDVADYLESVRERILEALGELIPFLPQSLLSVDSPHDGRAPYDAVRGEALPSPARWARGSATMETVYGYPLASTLGVCALPVRMPIQRVLLCGSQVVPGLGLEGQLLAAWSAVRIVSRSDKRPAVLRRGLWTKLES